MGVMEDNQVPRKLGSVCEADRVLEQRNCPEEDVQMESVGRPL